MSRFLFLNISLVLVLLNSAEASNNDKHNNVPQQQRSLQNFKNFGMCYIYEEFMGLTARRRDNCTCVEQEITCTSTYECDAPQQQEEQLHTRHKKKKEDAKTCSDYIHFNLFQPQGAQRGVELFNITACSNTYQRDGLEEICVDVTSTGTILRPTINECLSATYGGKPCYCEVCSEGMGLDIDCSQYNMYASSNGCRGVSINDVEAILPNLGFGDSPVVEEEAEAEESGSSSSSTAGSHNGGSSSSSTRRGFYYLTVMAFATMLL